MEFPTTAFRLGVFLRIISKNELFIVYLQKPCDIGGHIRALYIMGFSLFSLIG